MHSSSASRLSALAPPFTVSRPIPQQHQQLHASSLPDSLSALCLGDDTTDYGVHSDDLHSVPSLKVRQVALSSEGKEVYQDRILNEKGKELEDYIFVQFPSSNKEELLHPRAVLDNSSNPLPTEKYDMPVTHDSFPSFTPDLPSTEKGLYAKNSSESFDMYESDLDSPCWQGTMASRRSPFVVGGPATERTNSPSPKTELETCKSLNPLAPKFIPGHTGGRVDCSIKSVNRKQESIYDSKGGKYFSRTNNDVGTSCFNESLAPRNEYALLASSSSISEHRVSHMIKPTPVEDRIRSNANLLKLDIVGSSVQTAKVPTQNIFPCLSSIAIDDVSNVPSSAIAFPTGHEGKYQSASASYSMILMNTMLNLSELLIQNVSNDFDSIGEHHQDILEHIINNLSVCMGYKSVHRNLVTQSLYSGNFYPRIAHDFSKEKRTKAAGNSHWLGDQYEPMKQKNFTSLFSERDNRVAHSFCSTSDVAVKNRDDVHRVWERLMKENHDNDEELHSQVLLYKNLWLDAEAALCSMKRKACIARMKTQMDGSMSD